MKVLIVGATGMVGGIILNSCLVNDEISEVISMSRRTTGIRSDKLKELIRKDFLNYDDLQDEFKNVDVAYFCIGVYTGAVPDDTFKMITVDFAISFADKVKAESPKAIFSFLSGAGADQKEKSRTAFAKYKGMAENHLLKKEFKELYIFRPGYIYPVEKREEPNVWYRLFRKLYPLFKLFGKNMSVKSTELAEAMYGVFKKKPTKTILENRDIVELVG